MELQLSPLKKALNSLTIGLKRSLQDPSDLEVRDGCIQRFEYTYELSIKLIKRYLKTEAAITDNVDELNFRDLLREAAKIGLIQDVNAWFTFREAHNNTSHTYNEIKANDVFSVIPGFADEVQFLLSALERRTKHDIS